MTVIMVLPKNRIVRLSLPYRDFDGRQYVGDIDVLDILAPHITAIFKTIFTQNFPIYSMAVMEKFSFDDAMSMAANNTSGYNPRCIQGTDTVSMHAYGLAIDVNPRENPYIVDGVVYPEDGSSYLDRASSVPGMIEPIVPIFKDYGFMWGGDWATPTDYHHFQMPRVLAEFLVSMDSSLGQCWLDWYIGIENEDRIAFMDFLPGLILADKSLISNITTKGISITRIADILNVT